jgi:hypothetical protein
MRVQDVRPWWIKYSGLLMLGAVVLAVWLAIVMLVAVVSLVVKLAMPLLLVGIGFWLYHRGRAAGRASS